MPRIHTLDVVDLFQPFSTFARCSLHGIHHTYDDTSRLFQHHKNINIQPKKSMQATLWPAACVPRAVPSERTVDSQVFRVTVALVRRRRPLRSSIPRGHLEHRASWRRLMRRCCGGSTACLQRQSLKLRSFGATFRCTLTTLSSIL